MHNLHPVTSHLSKHVFSLLYSQQSLFKHTKTIVQINSRLTIKVYLKKYNTNLERIWLPTQLNSRPRLVIWWNSYIKCNTITAQHSSPIQGSFTCKHQFFIKYKDDRIYTLDKNKLKIWKNTKNYRIIVHVKNTGNYV